MHHRGAQIHQVATYGYVGRPTQMGMHNPAVQGSYGVQQQIQPQMQNQAYQMHAHMNQTPGVQRIGQQMPIQRIVPNQKRGRSAHTSYSVNTQNKRRSNDKRKSTSRNDSSKSSNSKGRSSSNSRKSYENSRRHQHSNRSKQAGASRKSSQKASFRATQADNGSINRQNQTHNNSTVAPIQAHNNSPAINPTHAHNNSATRPSQPHNTLPMQPNATQLHNNSSVPKPIQAHNNSTVRLMQTNNMSPAKPIQPGNSSSSMPIQPTSSPIMKSAKLSPLPTQLSQQTKSPISANNPSNQAHQPPTQPSPTKPMQPMNNTPVIQTKSEKERADEQWGDIVMFLCELVEKKQLNEEELQTLVTLALDRDQKLLTLYLGLNKRPKQFIHCVRAQLLK